MSLSQPDRIKQFKVRATQTTFKAAFMGWACGFLTFTVVIMGGRPYENDYILSGLKSVGYFSISTILPVLLASLVVGYVFVGTSLSCLKMVKNGPDPERPNWPTKGFLYFKGILAAILTLVMTLPFFWVGLFLYDQYLQPSIPQSLLSQAYQMILVLFYALMFGSWAIILIGIWHGKQIHRLVQELKGP